MTDTSRTKCNGTTAPTAVLEYRRGRKVTDYLLFWRRQRVPFTAGRWRHVEDLT